jgi:hypothetical protein
MKRITAMHRKIRAPSLKLIYCKEFFIFQCTAYIIGNMMKKARIDASAIKIAFPNVIPSFIARRRVQYEK